MNINNEGLVTDVEKGLLFSLRSSFITPPDVILGKPKPYYHNQSFELKAHKSSSSPMHDIPVANFSHHQNSLFGSQVKTGGYNLTTPKSSTSPPSSYVLKYLGLKPIEGAIPSDIVSMRPFAISCLPQSNQPRMETVRGYSQILFDHHNPPAPYF